MAVEAQSNKPEWARLLTRCQVDPSIERRVIDGFSFPLGVYPVGDDLSDVNPGEGFTSAFEPADGDSVEGEWEEWPDRYVYDVLISADRLDAFCRAVFDLLPARVYPILDLLGQDAFREIDPYVAYELVGQDRVLDAMSRYRPFLFEDGMVGYGAISEEPFLYVFVDEHKIVTIRAEAQQKERVEALLAALNLKEVEEIRGSDSTTHEHRSVLHTPDDRPDLLTADEIVEDLRESWRLTLNVDPETNLDDEGNELGLTGWRCITRWVQMLEGSDRPMPVYGEVILCASSLSEAEALAGNAMRNLYPQPAPPIPPDEPVVVVNADRVVPERLQAAMSQESVEADTSTAGILMARRLD